MGTRGWVWVGAWLGAAVAGWACGGAESEDEEGCPVGAFECACTAGGACDMPWVCVAGTCVDPGDTGSGTGTSAGMSTGASMPMTGSATEGESTADTTAGASSGGGEGPLLDVGSPDLGGLPATGCQAIDVLFAIDGSLSMAEERNALAATGSFTQVIDTLEGLNGGGIDYRIGVTDDNDYGFVVPPGWAGANPWFDSAESTPMEIASAFNGAVGVVGGLGGAPVGCEHVLTSASDLIAGDTSGFVREEALLVVVLLTDVDDYGAYDQPMGNLCGIGCPNPPSVLTDLYDALVAAKGGATEGVAGIVVAGDPTVMAGQNFCGQPGSCGCGGLDCAIFHATRLYDFATMLGSNGVAADLCAGPASVPGAVETALTSSIELACENFEPEG